MSGTLVCERLCVGHWCVGDCGWDIGVWVTVGGTFVCG